MSKGYSEIPAAQPATIRPISQAQRTFRLVLQHLPVGGWPGLRFGILWSIRTVPVTNRFTKHAISANICCDTRIEFDRPLRFRPQYPLSRAALQPSRRSSSRRRRKTQKPRAAFTCIFNQLPAAFQHHVYFHILAHCGRAMCLTFTSLQKKTGGGVLTFLPIAPSARGHQRGPAVGVMIGNHRSGSALHEQAGEVLAVAKGQDAPQNQDHESEGQPPVVHEQMIYEDVGDYRAQKGEPQRICWGR